MAESKKSKKSVELHGKVIGCKFLRLRSEPSLEAQCLTLLSDHEFVIDKKNSTEDFYKIAVLGLDGKLYEEGYVMKEFVETFKVEKKEQIEEAIPLEDEKESKGE